MPNVYRPPQPGLARQGSGAMNYRPGPGSPLDPQRALRQREAKRGLCLEIYYKVSLVPADRPRPRPRDGNDEERVIVPDVETIRRRGLVLVARCDRMSRTDRASIANQGHSQAGSEGAPAVRGHWFEEARACYRPAKEATWNAPSSEPDGGGDVFEDPDFVIDFAAFTEAVCGLEVPGDAYGTPEGLVRLSVEAHRHYALAQRYTLDLINSMVQYGCFGRPAVAPTYSGISEAVLSYMDKIGRAEADAFMQKMETRVLALKNAQSTFGVLEAKVAVILRERERKNQHLLETASDDSLAGIVQHLTGPAAAALMRTCRQFASMPEVKQRLPHLRIRSLIGSFPHHQVVSRDRTELAKGKQKPVVRDFVIAPKAVRVYVDFCELLLRGAPLKKKPRADGLSNMERDLSDDEYEDPPEAKSNRGPPKPTVDPRDLPPGDWSRKQAEAQARLRREWEQHDGPEEQYDRHITVQRVPYGRYFAAPLSVSACLVYADNHQKVEGHLPMGFEPSNALACDKGVFEHNTRHQSDSMPHHARLHVPHLTLDHGNRLFKLKVTGFGVLNELLGGGPFVQTVYSKPFEVVSKINVVHGAGKRRTQEQLTQHIKEQKAKKFKAKKEAAAKEGTAAASASK